MFVEPDAVGNAQGRHGFDEGAEGGSLAVGERCKIDFSAVGDACPGAAGKFILPRAAAGV